MAITGASERIPGLFLDRGAGAFHVEHPDFGAVGDGVTDDATAFNAAVTAASNSRAAGKGAKIICGPKNYVLGSNFTGFQDGMIVEGAGRDATQVYFSTGGVSVPAGIRGLQIRDMKIRGATTAAINFAADFGGVVLSNLLLVGPVDGVNATAGNCTFLKMENVRAEQVGGVGFNFDAGGNITLNSIIAENCYTNACTGVGWKLGNCRAVLIGCNADNGTTHGLEVASNGTDLTAINFSAEVNTGTGILIGGNGRFTLIQPVLVNQSPGISMNVANAYLTIIQEKLSSAPASDWLTLGANCDRVIFHKAGNSSDASATETIAAAPRSLFTRVGADGTVWIPTRGDGNRGAAGTSGRIIFNTDDGQINVDNGTNWTLPDGTTT